MDTVLHNQPETVRWSREIYARMAKLGWFEGRHVELVEGQIYEIHSPGTVHSAAAKLVFQALCAAVPKGYFVGFQNALNLGQCSEPRPDVSVLLGSPQDAGHGAPQRAALLVEVSDTTFEFDRTLKAGLYASSGISEYWILDLENHKLTVKRSPSCNALGAGRAGYLDVSVHCQNSTVSPLFATNRPIMISSLIPAV